MKIAALFIFTTIICSTNYAQDSLNFTKLSIWTSGDATAYNDCWGYTDENGREYAILGSNWGTHFIDVTDPVNPIEINSFIGLNSNVTWRDFKTYGNYAYGVADNFSNSLQIFDLSNLPTSVTKIYDSDALSSSAHNIFIEGDRIYLPANKRGGTFYELDILSIADPTNPTLIGTMDESYFGFCSGCIHDVYVKNDTVYCSAANTGLYIYDLKDPSTPILISNITGYSEQGYNHASWVNEDGNVMVMADETHGSGLKSFDLNDIENPVEIDVFRTVIGAIPHNPFIRGTETYISYYHDGMQVFDLSDPSNVTQKAFYDTYPDNSISDHSGYEGDWGVYPFFESRNIIASDITYGLFVLGKINDVYTTSNDTSICSEANIIVDFNIKGTYNGGNMFILEISDSNGTFINPTPIDTISSTSAGSFTANLSSSTVIPGNEYKLRVRSTNPAILEGEFMRLYINKEISLNFDTTICEGDSILFEGNTYDSTGIYTGILPGNCDTTFTLNLQVIEETSLLIDTAICEGEVIILGGNTYDTTGTYSGSFGSGNCDTTFNLTLSVQQIELPTIVEVDGILFTDSVYNSYQWYINGQPISGATNHNYIPPVSGTFTVKVTLGNCTKISEEYVYSKPGSISEQNSSSFFKIYPNPSKNVVIIESKPNQNAELHIYNSIGGLVNIVNFKSKYEVNLERGIYLFKINSKDKYQTIKVIID